MIAIDSSALAAFILKEPGWEGLARHISRSLSLDLAFIEVSNAIWKLYMRKAVDRDTALKLYRTLRLLEEINIKIEPARMYMDEALEIALDTGLTIYDALYIALARSKNLPLLTLDAMQRKAAETMGVRVI